MNPNKGLQEAATPIGWKIAAAGLLAAVLAAAGVPPALAQTAAPSTEPVPEGKGLGAGVRVYLHPVRRFTIPVPRDAQVSEPDNAARVIIDSRQGYRIIIQANDAKPKVPLSEMNNRFEEQYLGQGKPLSLKLAENLTMVAGLDAVEAKYEGAGSLSRVVIARGVKTDFVFMFFAPRDRYEQLEREFQWVLDNFIPNPADRPAAASASKAPAKAPAAAKPPPPPKRFADAGYGYAIQYPGDWEVSKPTTNIASFSGAQGTDAYYAVISIQNVQPPSATSAADATRAALADHQAMLKREASEVQVIGEQPLIYKNGTLSLTGRQMVVTYTYAGERYRKWMVVVPRPDGAIAHIWAYTAPEIRFDTFRPIADTMLRSWTIQTGG
jgi:hypothetical protein